MDKELGDTVAVFAPYFPPAFLGGGPIRTLDALVRQSPTQFDIYVLTRNSDLNARTPLPINSDSWIDYHGAKVRYVNWKHRPSFLKATASLRFRKPGVIYLNSFFDFWFSILPAIFHRLGYFSGSRLVIAPRGEFGPAALRIKPGKKRIYIAFYKFLLRNDKSLWHASSPLEQQHIRQIMGPSAEILVRENDSLLADHAREPVVPESNSLSSVFVGRLAPVKGVDILLRALAQIEETVKLDIVGSFQEPEFVEQCRVLTADLPKNISVNYLGPVDNSDVSELISKHDVMLFPTHGENFGHVIGEALAASCPVICSDVTPWTSTLQSGGGVVVHDHSVQGWVKVIKSYSQLTVHEKLDRKYSAKSAYELRRSQTKPPHIFTLVESVEV